MVPASQEIQDVKQIEFDDELIFFLLSFLFFSLRVTKGLSVLLVFSLSQLLVLLISSTAVSNELIATFFFIKFSYNHTILPLADGLFDRKSAGTGVSL